MLHGLTHVTGRGDLMPACGPRHFATAAKEECIMGSLRLSWTYGCPIRIQGVDHQELVFFLGPSPDNPLQSDGDRDRRRSDAAELLDTSNGSSSRPLKALLE